MFRDAPGEKPSQADLDVAGGEGVLAGCGAQLVKVWKALDEPGMGKFVLLLT